MHHFQCNRSNKCTTLIVRTNMLLFVSKTYKKTITAEDEDVIVSILLLPTVFALRLHIARNEKQARACATSSLHHKQKQLMFDCECESVCTLYTSVDCLVYVNLLLGCVGSHKQARNNKRLNQGFRSRNLQWILLAICNTMYALFVYIIYLFVNKSTLRSVPQNIS